MWRKKKEAKAEALLCRFHWQFTADSNPWRPSTFHYLHTRVYHSLQHDEVSKTEKYLKEFFSERENLFIWMRNSVLQNFENVVDCVGDTLVSSSRWCCAFKRKQNRVLRIVFHRTFLFSHLVSRLSKHLKFFFFFAISSLLIFSRLPPFYMLF